MARGVEEVVTPFSALEAAVAVVAVPEGPLELADLKAPYRTDPLL